MNIVGTVTPEQGLDAIVNPSFKGGFITHSTEPDGLVLGVELALAEHFDVDRAEDQLRQFSFGIDTTWKSLVKLYNKTQNSAPAEIFIGVELEPSIARATYVMPFNKVSLKQAVTITNIYEPKLVKRGRARKAVNMLGKNCQPGSRRIISWPNISPVGAIVSTEHVGRVTDDKIRGGYIRRGALGTI
jgi:hypothetical protein